MARIIIPAVTELYLCDQRGVRLECLDYVTEYDYTLTVNTPAPFRLKLPAKFDRSKVQLDNIIEIWRGHGPGTLKLDYVGFIRNWRFADDAGAEYTELYGYSPIELLLRRIVAGAAGSSYADKTTYSDDMIKEIVNEQSIGSSAARYFQNFTIAADTSDGLSITKAFAYKNVLEICQEISASSAQTGTSAPGGEVYFDVVPLISSSPTGEMTFQLRTFPDQRGADRTWDSSQPAFVGPEWGNFQNGALEYDYSTEINYVYAMGQGEGADREKVEAYDTARMGTSIWNLREGVKDARHIDFGDTTALTGEATTMLYENRPRFRFSGDIVETQSFRYGRDWGFGDRVTASYAGIQRDAMIKTVVISKDSTGQEQITARLEVEED